MGLVAADVGAVVALPCKRLMCRKLARTGLVAGVKSKAVIGTSSSSDESLEDGLGARDA